MWNNIPMNNKNWVENFLKNPQIDSLAKSSGNASLFPVIIQSIQSKSYRAKTRDSLGLSGQRGQDLFVEISSGQIIQIQFEEGAVIHSKVIEGQSFDDLSAISI
jgi:hypothetical protein